jgi:hypothetical protein
MNDKDHIIRQIEARFIERCKLRGDRVDANRPSDKVLQAQAEYYAGAMTALQAVYGEPAEDALTSMIPPIWVISVMTGRLIQPVYTQGGDVYTAQKTQERDA